MMGGGGSGGGLGGMMGGGGMGGGGGGADSFYIGTGMLTKTDGALGAIQSDTDQILTHVATIDSNVQNMTDVMKAKQELILSVAQMNLLVTQGKVIQVDPMNPNSGPGNTVSQVVDSIVNAGSNVNYANSAGSSNYPPSVGPVAGGSSTVPSTPAGPAGGASPAIPSGPNTMGIFQLGSAQAISLAANPNAFLNAIQGASMQVATQVLSQIGTSVMGLIFNGGNRTFSGLNANNIDNIMGNNGHILAIDHQTPQTLYPASPSYLQMLKSAGYNIPTGTVTANGEKVADGIYLRRQAPYDAAYVKMVERGTGVSKMQFYSAISQADVVTYSAIAGNSQSGYGFRSSINMNDALSGGAYNAVSAYNSQVGGGPNPYATFAPTVAPLLPDFANNVSPSNILEIPSNAVNSAKSVPPINLMACGTLEEARGKKEMTRFAAIFAPFDRHKKDSDEYMKVQDTGATSQPMVMVFGLTKSQNDDLMARVRNSDTQVQQGRSVIVMDQLMLQYSRNVLTASNNLRNALQKTSSNMTNQNAIESVAMMIQNCDNMALVLQRQIADYATDIQRLLTEQHKELVARDEVVSKAVDDVNSSVDAKAQALVAECIARSKNRFVKHPDGSSYTHCSNQ